MHLDDDDLARIDAARAAARTRFAHLADEPDSEAQDSAETDPDNLPLTDAELARLHPAAEVVPGLVAASLRHKGGRPKSENPKVAVSIRLDADVLDALRAGGPGWQGRANAALRKAVGLDVSA